MTEQKQQQTNWPLENIRVPGDHDVIFGRGGASIHHAGCKAYREMVRAHQRQYIGYDDSRHMKTLLTHELVKKWREQTPPGRFLKKDEQTGLWHDVGVKIARRKTAQLLREGAKQVRKEMRAETESSSSSEDENEAYAAPLPPTKKQKRDEPNLQESLVDYPTSSRGPQSPPSLPRQSAIPVTPGSAASHPGMMIAVMAPATPPAPAIPTPAPMEVTVSGVQLANLSADLRSMARTAFPNNSPAFQYGQPKNSTEMLEIMFEGILDDTANPQQATSS